jgi:purine-nucleoside phosphorylase
VSVDVVYEDDVSEHKVGIVLGSGLGTFADILEHRFETSYSEIAGWPPSTAVGHAGKMVTGASALPR